jgi:hypothetical protein
VRQKFIVREAYLQRVPRIMVGRAGKDLIRKTPSEPVRSTHWLNRPRGPEILMAARPDHARAVPINVPLLFAMTWSKRRFHVMTRRSIPGSI